MREADGRKRQVIRQALKREFGGTMPQKELTEYGMKVFGKKAAR